LGWLQICPPHRLDELIDALISLIRKSRVLEDGLLVENDPKGPDVPNWWKYIWEKGYFRSLIRPR